ncbi:MAG: bifunctional diaminohydroxyphosphoribosylaminopyrimidine deaminase/5-amino-6-(5-phosphoribosylamino)uracil reductase RibD [Planctomycetota bacterium]|nr:bifunctional diaminohydroxyphosphoribosylaminopyrimidine deaminase/5-amino-6-(5-phosphoribosylamino)uracil reductase RibD [Planctomycetota bacterium]
MNHRQQDAHWMRKALGLAKQGQGLVEPNPMVGCVLVTQDQVEIGAGFHERYGAEHAEPRAIRDAIERGNEAHLPGCTAYVTLEPCCHHGKTPPCTRALLDAKVARVVVAMQDPFAEVAGRGLNLLRQAGMEVATGIEEASARELNAPYLLRLENARPWIIGKWAMSLDGKIATHRQDSQWISSPTSREYVHRLRGRVDAIMVGIDTALADNPMLTCRSEKPAQRIAHRVILDSRARLPVESKLAQTAKDAPVTLVVGPDACQDNCSKLNSLGVEIFTVEESAASARLQVALRSLATEKGTTNLLCEGGGGVLGSLHDAGMLDELEVFIAPKLIGNQNAISPIGGAGIGFVCDSATYQLADHELLEQDIHTRYRRHHP